MAIRGTQPSPGKSYPGSADEDYTNEVFDMSYNDTSMYGNYSVEAPVIQEAGSIPASFIMADDTYFQSITSIILSATDILVSREMADKVEVGVDLLDGGEF